MQEAYQSPRISAAYICSGDRLSPESCDWLLVLFQMRANLVGGGGGLAVLLLLLEEHFPLSSSVLRCDRSASVKDAGASWLVMTRL